MQLRLDVAVIRLRQPLKELVEGDGIVVHTHATGIVDRIGDGRSDPADAELAHPLAFIGDEIGSVSSRKITSWCGISAWTGTS